MFNFMQFEEARIGKLQRSYLSDKILHSGFSSSTHAAPIFLTFFHASCFQCNDRVSPSIPGLIHATINSNVGN